MSELIPIFPLEVVVYPGDELNLHIFEPRYQALIKDTAKTKAPFGIPTVLEQKIGGWGTLVKLTQIANVEADGQMDIRPRGLRVFRVRRLLKTYSGKLYSAAEVEYSASNGAGDPKVMRAVVAEIRKLHRLLNVTKNIARSEAKLTSYDVAHQAGLSLKQEYDLLMLTEERERQKYLLRHLEQVLPVVAEMESLKEKINLNGHFKTIPGWEAS
jgi:Lon protease-like protein